MEGNTIRNTRVVGVVRRWIAELMSRWLRPSRPGLVSFPAESVESAGGATPPPSGGRRGKGRGGKAAEGASALAVDPEEVAR